MITTVHPNLAALPWEEFKAYIEKVLPGEDPEALYVAAGNRVPATKVKTPKEKGE
jgi:hypothetical protein